MRRFNIYNLPFFRFADVYHQKTNPGCVFCSSIPMNKYKHLLSGGDLRSVGNVNALISTIHSQQEFDLLFELAYDNDRVVKMRAMDAIEKITKPSAGYLQSHKQQILKLIKDNTAKEYKWHLALLLPRLNLNKKELASVWDTLTQWVNDKTNSKIVRVNSIQGLYDLCIKAPHLMDDFNLIIQQVEIENIPSINARIRLIKKNMIKKSSIFRYRND